MTTDDQRLQNQLEALKNAIAGTNADLLILLNTFPRTRQTARAIATVEGRLKALSSLSFNTSKGR